MGAKHSDFGNIIAGEFKKATKGLKGEAKFIVLNITNAGGQKRRVKVIDAGPDSVTGYVGNLTGEGFATTVTIWNPDQIVGYERPS